MIDTHAHIYAEEFEGDIMEVLDRANSSGVRKILLPNIDVESIESLKAMVQLEHDIIIHAMMGLHPCSVKEDYKAQLKVIESELRSGDYLAVGEIGMDLYWDKTKRAEQEDAFRIQCAWATELYLPIAIHCRESTDEIIQILKEYLRANTLSGVFHCFGGSVEQAAEILDLGFYLGIGGVLTFKYSNLREVLKSVPLDKIMLETDAPYLAPVPYRGKRNEPSYVREVASALSEVYNVSLDEIIEATSHNASELFKL